MNFIEAIKLAKQGKRIRSQHTGEKYYQMSDNNQILVDEDYNTVWYINLEMILNEYDGWEIYKEKSKTYNFQEAFKALKEGKMIRRLETPDKAMQLFSPLIMKDLRFNYDDIVATDWIIED
jgi:hypothetical protein